MDMYVVCESRDGKASRAAEAISEAAAANGVATLVRSIDEAVPDDLVAADAIIAGCRLQADTPFGGSIAGRLADWIAGLPDLDGQAVGVFCTYSFFPHTFADVTARTAEVLNDLGEGFRTKGGDVVASHALHVRDLEGDAVKLVSKLVDSVNG
ncbi:MAG: hypothetical protein ABFR89_11875 [Actinomycetota bacterium]